MGCDVTIAYGLYRCSPALIWHARNVGSPSTDHPTPYHDFCAFQNHEPSLPLPRKSQVRPSRGPYVLAMKKGKGKGKPSVATTTESESVAAARAELRDGLRRRLRQKIRVMGTVRSAGLARGEEVAQRMEQQQENADPQT